jgi:hypothetical protein
VSGEQEPGFVLRLALQRLGIDTLGRELDAAGLERLAIRESAHVDDPAAGPLDRHAVPAAGRHHRRQGLLGGQGFAGAERTGLDARRRGGQRRRGGGAR